MMRTQFVHGKVRKVRYHWNYKKFIGNMLILMMVSFFLVSYLSHVARAVPEKTKYTVLVERGDTLWSIARKYIPGVDPRYVVNEIKTQNRLSNGHILPGQELVLEVNQP